MRRLRSALVRLAALARRRHLDRQLDDEIRSHLELHTDDNRRAGMAPEEARRQASLALGGVEATKERYRRRRGVPALEALAADFRLAVRGLRRTPGFTAAVTLMLGTGIAATATAFSLLNAMVLTPALPIAEPERLVEIGVSRQAPGSAFGRIDSTYDDFLALQHGLPALAAVSARFDTRIAVSIDRTPLAVAGAVVSDNYFDVLRMPLAAGRGFTASSSRGQPQVVISHAFWRRHFAGVAAVGKELVVNGSSVPVVGVMARGERGGPDVWMPFAIAHLALRDADGRPTSAAASPPRYFRYHGRLAADATLAQARAQASAVARAIESIDPGRGKVTVGVGSLTRGRSLGGIAMEALSFLAVPLVVLAIACLNAASLLLARSTRRGREWALRKALGSPAYRLVGYVLIESLLLAAAAAGIGLVASTQILSIVERYLPSGDLLAVDVRVALFTIAIAIVTALAFGLGPALRAASSVSAGGPAAPRLSMSPVSRARLVLVAVQVTLSLSLLAVGWQFVHAVRSTDAALDFRDAKRVLVASFDLDPLGLPASAAEDFFERLLDRTSALPDVGAAALTNVPIRGAMPAHLAVRAWLPESSPAAARRIAAAHVSGDPGEALDLHLEAGRWFRPEDGRGLPRSVIVNRALADRQFGGQALGRTFEIATLEGTSRHPVTVIGVIATSRGRPLRSSGPAMLLPAALTPTRVRTLWIRSRPDAAVDAAMLHAVARDIDPRVPIDRLTNAGDLLAVYESDHRGAITATVVLGIVALLLSAAGLYGLLSYVVSLRAKEIGIRAVLGAEPSALVRLMVRQAAAPVGIGLVCGIGIAVTSGLVLRSLIYGTSPIDPMALAGASVVLVIVMAVAAATPSWRAARADAMVALRED
jgi:predicted permease